ncbi:MAG TPA: hypothetical protein VJT31_24865 [Rugosimonospora sp.]|nr:hypothetical protein [Rugosimonospora sp.]
MTATRRRAALLAVALAGATAGCSAASPSTGAICGMSRADLLAVLRDKSDPPSTSVERIDKQVCADNWIFVRGTFVLGDGSHTDSTAVLLHRAGVQWQVAYLGTAPMDPGDPACRQMPAEIRRADEVFQTSCPA